MGSNIQDSWSFGSPYRPRAARRFSMIAVMTAVLMVFGGVALADGIQGDTDAVATSAPSANGLDATQDIGTSHDYDYSAFITNTGTSSNNVFAASGDTVSGSVAITANDLGWTASVNTQFTGGNAFTAYDQNRAGLLSVTVPGTATDGEINHIKVEIAATASNGKSMAPDNVVLNYNITAHQAACVVTSYTATWRPPIDTSTNTLNSQVINTTKLGRVVPLKVTLVDNCGNSVLPTSGKDVSAKVYEASAPANSVLDGVETYADAGQANDNTICFRWSSTDSFWIYNLDTSNKGSFGALQVNKIYKAEVGVAADSTTGCDTSGRILADPDALLKMMK